MGRNCKAFFVLMAKLDIPHRVSNLEASPDSINIHDNHDASLATGNPVLLCQITTVSLSLTR